jgi:hypothetical protein
VPSTNTVRQVDGGGPYRRRITTAVLMITLIVSGVS